MPITTWVEKYKANGKQVATADATPTTVASIDVSALGVGVPVANATIWVEGRLYAVSGSNFGFCKIGQTFKVSGGALSAIGALQVFTSGAAGALIGDAGLATASGTFDASGSSVRLRAVGIAATNIVWDGYLDLSTGGF